MDACACLTDQEWINAAIENDRPGLLNGVMWLFNCREADEDDGRIWIANPQRGHWLDDDDIARISNALAAGDI